MEKRFAWLGAAAVVFAVWRWLRGKSTRATPKVEEEDPAESLRAKLEESRAASDEVSTAPVDDADPDSRRKSVHDDARARIDELRGE